MHISVHGIRLIEDIDLEFTGVVQVNFSNIWGHICPENWTDASATVRHLPQLFHHG